MIGKKFIKLVLSLLVINMLILCSVFSAFPAENNLTVGTDVFESFEDSDDERTDYDPDAYILANKRRSFSADEEFEPDRVIVVLKHKYSKINKVRQVSDFSSSLFSEVKDLSYVESYSTKDLSTTTKVSKNEFHQILSLKLKNPGKENVIKAITYLNTLDEVLSAEPDYIYECQEAYVPNDTRYSEQWGLEQINIEDAWNITRGSTSVKVGIFEDGITSHEDIASSRIVQGNKTYSSSSLYEHGTLVTGIIGATANNNKGIAGIAKVKLTILDNDKFVESLTYAANNNIGIINASYHYVYENDVPAGYDSSHAAAIQNYPGVLICSAGNDRVNLDNTPYYPAAYNFDNVIAVAATTDNDVLWTYYDNYGELKGSNYSPTKVHLAAPGDNILTTLDTGGYRSFEGTSTAAPHVTGVAALLKSKYPAMSGKAIKYYITQNVDKVSSLSGKVSTGGRLNAYKALNNVKQFTVKYNAGGGTGTMADTTVIYNNTTALRSNQFINHGATFLGWNSKRLSDNKCYYTNGSSKGWYLEGQQPSGYYKYLYPNGATLSKTSSRDGDTIMMYAQWDVRYIVSFNSNGGTGTMQSMSVQYGVPYTLTSNAFSRTGYHFDHWYAKKANGDTYCVGPSVHGWYLISDIPADYVRREFADDDYIYDYSLQDIIHGDVITMYVHWEPNAGLLGDVNMNGTVNSKDVTLIQKYLADLETLTSDQMYLADVDYNGAVTMQDASKINKYIAGIIRYWDE